MSEGGWSWSTSFEQMRDRREIQLPRDSSLRPVMSVTLGLEVMGVGEEGGQREKERGRKREREGERSRGERRTGGRKQKGNRRRGGNAHLLVDHRQRQSATDSTCSGTASPWRRMMHSFRWCVLSEKYAEACWRTGRRLGDLSNSGFPLRNDSFIRSTVIRRNPGWHGNGDFSPHRPEWKESGREMGQVEEESGIRGRNMVWHVQRGNFCH